jgi:uncharacterized protein YcaQ
LLVQASWVEPGSDPGVAADAAAGELIRMARWLGSAVVVVLPRGNLSAGLARRPGMRVDR